MARRRAGQLVPPKEFGRWTSGNHHYGKISLREFSAQKIISEIPIDGGEVTLREPGQSQEKVFYLRPDRKFRAHARKGDLVILQKLEVNNDVRFVLVLCGNYEVEKPIHVQYVRSAFTLDTVGTRIRDDAISVENCPDHVRCKKIGIHVVAIGGRDKIRADLIEPYGSSWRKYWGMGQGERRPALSVFFHTRSDEVTGPEISVIEIDRNYECGKSVDIDSINDIWERFVGVGLQNRLSRTSLFAYVVYSPSCWRDYVLLVSISMEYTKVITEVARSANGINFVTAERELECSHSELSKVTIFKDECDQLARNRGRVGDDAFVLFSSRVCQFSQPHVDGRNYFPKAYYSDVESPPRERSVVKCTSPLVRFKDFLNQQILTRYLVNPQGPPLYTREDLLGLLVPRFKTPTLKKAIFTKFNRGELSVLLRYVNTLYINTALSVLEFSQFARTEIVQVRFGIEKIYYPGLQCADADYCNRNLVHFDHTIYKDLSANWENRDNLTEILQKFDQEKCEETSPYKCKVENGERLGTVLTLKRGAELQIQISQNDVKDLGISLGLRMLRIGRDCHLCFTHINYPEKAFMSDRSDVRQLITNETIIALQKATTDDILASSGYIKVKIEWVGEYMVGGSFLFDGGENVDARDLLCIRKEIFCKDALKYVWCCHGVVKSVDGNRVQFATCTLSQTQDPLQEGNFCITLIRPKTIELKIAARQGFKVKRRSTM